MTDILRLSVPITLWLAMFSAVYALQGLLCSSRWPGDADTARAALIAAWLVAIAVQGAAVLVLGSRRGASSRPFIRNTSLALAVAALVAAIWTMMPIATTTACL